MAELFIPNKELQKCVEKLVDAFKEVMKPGDVLTNEQIGKLTGILYKSERWGSLIRSTRKRLLEESQIFMRNVRGLGYAFSKDNEHFREGASGYKRAGRQWKKADKVIENIDTKTASQRVLDARMHILHMSAMARDCISATIKTVKRLPSRERMPQIADGMTEIEQEKKVERKAGSESWRVPRKE